MVSRRVGMTAGRYGRSPYMFDRFGEKSGAALEISSDSFLIFRIRVGVTLKSAGLSPPPPIMAWSGEIAIVGESLHTDAQLIAREQWMPLGIIMNHCLHREIKTLAFPKCGVSFRHG